MIIGDHCDSSTHECGWFVCVFVCADDECLEAAAECDVGVLFAIDC